MIAKFHISIHKKEEIVLFKALTARGKGDKQRAKNEMEQKGSLSRCYKIL